MRIVEVRVTVVGAPWRDLTFVELVTDDDRVGVGEVRMVNKTATLVACVEELAPRYLVGADPFDVELLAWRIQRAEYGRIGEVAQSALAAFDVACWDLQLAPHNVCGPVGTAANVHLAVATRNHLVLEHFNDFADPWVADLVDTAPRVDAEDGRFGLPERPGLGVTLDHTVCADHPATGGRLRLFTRGWERREVVED